MLEFIMYICTLAKHWTSQGDSCSSLNFHLLLGKKVQLRKPAPGASDAVPSRKRPTPVNLASAIKRGNSAISQRPFKDRVVHLLALKPYKKPELILRLQKDGLSQQDKDLLDSLLQQVSVLPRCLPKSLRQMWCHNVGRFCLRPYLNCSFDVIHRLIFFSGCA